MKSSKFLLAGGLLAGAALILSGCASAAETTSYNISEAADNFQIDRRIVFFNGITDTYLLEIQGRCSIEDSGGQLEVTCKVSDEGDGEYKKHFLGLSDNVSYFVEQVEGYAADPWHYRVIFRPETIIPDIDVLSSGDPLPNPDVTSEPIEEEDEG